MASQPRSSPDGLSSESTAESNVPVNRKAVKRKPVPGGSKNQEQKEHFEDAFSDIALAACAVVLPMLALTAAFIGVVFHLRVLVSQPGLTNSPFGESLAIFNDSTAVKSAYFVAIDSARLVTIASWTSTAISFLPPWLMVLYSYKAADSFQKAKPKNLPTPLQFWLLVDLFNGSYGSLWNWSKYRKSKAKRSRTNIEVSKGVAVSSICMTLGVLLLLADTWLHLTTTSVLLQRTLPASPTTHLLSRDLAPTCYGAPDRCTTSHRTYNGTGEREIIDATSAYQTLFNVSSTTAIRSLIEADEQYLFYTPAHIPQNMSYRASTMAMKIACRPITQACDLHVIEPQARNITLLDRDVELQYFCSPSYAGDMLNYQQLNISISGIDGSTYSATFFKDASLAETVTFDEDRNLFVDYQPIYMVTGAISIAANKALLSDPQIVEAFTGTAAFLLECASQFVQMNYTSSSGHLQDVQIAPAEDDAVIAMSYPFTIDQAWTYVASGLRQACLEKTADDMAASFARSYANAVLSMGVGAVVPAPALQASVMSLEQITRLPKAPFFTLLILNCVYASVGIVLAIIALASKPRSIKPIQARLSGLGLVAALFEGDRADRPVYSMKDLFAENAPGPNLDVDRVALLQTDGGGWSFGTVKP